MPYVPDPKEIVRLRAAIDRAALSEVERIFWLVAFAGLMTLDGFLLAGRVHWVGILGMLGGYALLYWRIRGGHLAQTDRELHGIGLRTEEQRAFTALMLRQALTGRNALSAKPEHDPIALWSQRIERSEAPVEEA